MRIVDDGIRPYMGCASVKRSQNADIGVRKGPERLVAWVRSRPRRDDFDAAAIAEGGSDVCARVPVACS
jgi:hypothetical protein